MEKSREKIFCSCYHQNVRSASSFELILSTGLLFINLYISVITEKRIDNIHEIHFAWCLNVSIVNAWFCKILLTDYFYSYILNLLIIIFDIYFRRALIDRIRNILINFSKNILNSTFKIALISLIRT